MRRLIPVVTLALIAVGCGGGNGTGGVVGGQGSVTFLQVQASVFTPNCAITGCHVGSGAPFGLDLSEGQAFGNIVGVPSSELPAFDRIDPFNAADSYLFMKVSGDPRILGDPMPALGVPLSSQKQSLLEDWITEGANP